MIGAIIGDIAGSRFEFDNYRAKDFDMFTPKCFATDDSIMTLAVCDALMQTVGDDLGAKTVESMRYIGRMYPGCGYGGHFYEWMFGKKPKPYGSYGNGAAMRVGGCGWVGQNENMVKRLAKAVTEVTHNHPEGIKGAEATAMCVYLARCGVKKKVIREYVEAYYYPLDFTIDGIRNTYQFNETCQETVPQAIEAFLESSGFEDAIRTAVSVGGDSDTLACITGAIAEAYYGVPLLLRKIAETYLDDRLKGLLRDFEERYPSR